LSVQLDGSSMTNAQPENSRMVQGGDGTWYEGTVLGLGNVQLMQFRCIWLVAKIDVGDGPCEITLAVERQAPPPRYRRLLRTAIFIDGANPHAALVLILPSMTASN
jgi:hypothetical protein